MLRRFSALTHRLELQVLWGMFKMWPKIDRYLKKKDVLFLRGERKRVKKEGCAHCAALVEGNCRKVEAFKEVFKGNTLASSIFKEYHLKKKKNRIRKLAAVKCKDFNLFNFAEIFLPCWGSLPSGFFLLCLHSPFPQSTSSF